MNANGQVVGISDSASSITVHATKWSDGAVIDLGSFVPGRFGYSYAWDINAAGDVVGTSDRAVGSTGSTTRVATLWTSQGMFDLNDLIDPATAAKWQLYSAQAINDGGMIVGNATNIATGDRLGFILTPIPEAEIQVMLLAGLVVSACVSRRRSRASY